MRFSFFLFLLTCSTSLIARADSFYYSGSIAEGTESFSNITSTEFLLESSNQTLRLCGFWHRDSGVNEKFEKNWILNGSRILNQDQKELGSFYDGNMLLEEPVTNSRGVTEFHAYEITRQGPSYFTLDFHDPARGFVNADGWLQKSASMDLSALCL